MGETLLTSTPDFKKYGAKDIVAYAAQESLGELHEEDLIIRKYSVNFAQGDKDPFDNVLFYNPPKYHCKHAIVLTRL